MVAAQFLRAQHRGPMPHHYLYRQLPPDPDTHLTVGTPHQVAAAKSAMQAVPIRQLIPQTSRSMRSGAPIPTP